MHLYNKILIPLLAILIFACKKEESLPPKEIPFFNNGLLVVNEGLFQQNNSTLSWINLATGEVNSQLFEQKTQRQLGDTGNDIQKYGSKIYLTVSVSSTIEIMDANSGNSIKQLSMVANNISKQPRFMKAVNGKVFITCFDGYVDVLDTASLEIINRIQVGANPEDIVLSNNQLYITNSGGVSYPNVDSTISIIDPYSLVELNRVVVGKNPTKILADDNGDLYVITQKGLNTLNQQLVKLNHTTLQIDTIFNYEVNRMEKMGNKLLLYIAAPGSSSIQLFDMTTQTIENSNFIPSNHFTTFFGFQYDPKRNYIYCFDAKSYVNQGFVKIYSTQGTFIKEFKVGLNPSKLLSYE